MKSKWLGGQVHGICASSISNLQLGGVQAGWMGDMSVPMISAEGNWSAKSLVTCQRWLAVMETHSAYIAHMPVPVPTSKTFYGRRVSYD